MSRENQSKELVSITALRGLAALGVVLFHVRVDLWVGWRALRVGVGDPSFGDRLVAWLSIPTPFLGSGVMLFFLISGFCIALPYAGESGRPLHWREYLARRLGRIYPPYLATLGLCFLVEWMTRQALPGSPPAALLATAGMVQNYTTGQVVSNPSFWSLPVEVELYLLFPLCHLLFRRWGSAAVFGITGVVSAAALGGYLLGFDWLDVNAAKYWVLWSAGAVLAEWHSRGRLTSPPPALLVAGAIVAALTVVAQLQGVRAAILHFGYGFVYFVLIWWALKREEKWAALSAVLRRPLLLLGTISYSLYLVHFPLFRLCGFYWVQVFGQKPVNFLIPVGFAIVAVGVGWIFYRVVEAPSHALAKRLAGYFR
jgi:peptidoglycan/LPS O-acetylase OafA/YrhL